MTGRPASHIRGKLPKRVREALSAPKRWAVIWTHYFGARRYIDPIWHVDADSHDEALVKARETGRPVQELSVKEEPGC